MTESQLGRTRNISKDSIPFVSKLTWLLAVPLVQTIVLRPIAVAIARTRSLETEKKNENKRNNEISKTTVLDITVWRPIIAGGDT